MLVRYLCSLTLLLTVASTRVQAANPVSWAIDVSTMGEDVFWSSPTAITTGLGVYDWSYEISKITATATILGDQDITDLLGEDTMGNGSIANLPIVLLDEAVDDTTTGSEAHVFIEVDNSGFGQAAITEIILGSVSVFDITKLRVEATVNIVGYQAGDFDKDFDVDGADFLMWQRGESTTPHSAGDLADWQANYGSPPPNIFAIPEPSAWALLVLSMLLFPQSRDRWSRR